MTISSAISKALPAAESVRKWRPAMGHVYQLPSHQPAGRAKGQDSKEDTPMPDGAAKAAPATQKDEVPMERAAEEAFMSHMRHGGEYVDENPITGRPGEFHLSSTGRKVVVPLPKKGPEGVGTMNGPAAINTKVDTKKDGKTGRTPKSASTPRLKRKKSKMSAANTPVAT